MGQPSSKSAVILYHYTDEAGKDAILKSRFIKMSTNFQLDAIYGKGVYMTSMGPFKYTREKVIANNWVGRSFSSVKDKTCYVFQVKVTGSNLRSHKDGDRDIYVYGLENLVLDLLEGWTLYDWTSNTPKKIKSGTFKVLTPGIAQYM